MDPISVDEAHVLLDVLTLGKLRDMMWSDRPWAGYGGDDPEGDPKQNYPGWIALLRSARSKLEQIVEAG
jgi:hypothetical protein